MLRPRPGFTVWQDAGPQTLRDSYENLVAANPLPPREKRAALRHVLGAAAGPALEPVDSHWNTGDAQDLPPAARLFIDLLMAGDGDAFPADVIGHESRAWRDLVAFAQQARVIAAGGLPA